MIEQPLIFKHYPKLQNKIPYILLGNFPTPVIKLQNVGKFLKCNNLYLKRDDISALPYGGNKIRKLEFILADAKSKNKNYVLSIGAAGSNHCLATTIYANKCGMKNIAVLFPQPKTDYLKKNLLLHVAFGGKLVYLPSVYLVPFAIMYYLIKISPYYIPPGGSSVLGCIGYVNASFELKNQIDENLVPEPDLIFVPAGTCGTSAGLELGVRIAGLKSKVVSVKVVEKIISNKNKIASLANKTSLFLNSIDDSFPKIKIKPQEIVFLDDYFGCGYAKFTKEGIASVKIMEEMENIHLEGTYTGKTLAALFDWCKNKNISSKTILFWNTYNSQDMSNYISNISYTELPSSLQKYF